MRIVLQASRAISATSRSESSSKGIKDGGMATSNHMIRSQLTSMVMVFGERWEKNCWTFWTPDNFIFMVEQSTTTTTWRHVDYYLFQLLFSEAIMSKMQAWKYIFWTTKPASNRRIIQTSPLGSPLGWIKLIPKHTDCRNEFLDLKQTKYEI